MPVLALVMRATRIRSTGGPAGCSGNGIQDEPYSAVTAFNARWAGYNWIRCCSLQASCADGGAGKQSAYGGLCRRRCLLFTFNALNPPSQIEGTVLPGIILTSLAGWRGCRAADVFPDCGRQRRSALYPLNAVHLPPFLPRRTGSQPAARDRAVTASRWATAERLQMICSRES